MTLHLQQEIGKLKRKMLAFAALVERAVQKSVQSIESRDGRLAREVIDGDTEIDHMEVEIEEDCLKILALYQPVAIDLRFIVTVLKLNGDLERVGDLAVNIAERTVFLATQDPIDVPYDFKEMCRNALDMLRKSLDSLMNLDVNLAHAVRTSDDTVDEINRKMFVKISQAVQAQPSHVDRLLSYLSASRHLERMADYATNIAEDVIYMVKGDIVRHKPL